MCSLAELRERYPSSGEDSDDDGPKKRSKVPQSNLAKAKQRQERAALLKFENDEAAGLKGRKPRVLNLDEDRTVRVGDSFLSR